MSMKSEFLGEVQVLITRHFGISHAVPKATVKGFVDALLDLLFQQACRFGYWRLPRGLGSLKVRKLGGGVSVHPRTGQRVTREPRETLRYLPGKRVLTFLRGGDWC